ncbi:MAG TPA: 1-acyl-sn-glycerol-3-phosphate acyltransferase [Pseudomonadales bacterium]|nr:1-acyl-sn-glycerol-3-phosphate acyltransferase [Pseudomonadales bacterium]
MQALSRWVLRVGGWRLLGGPPAGVDRYVLLAAPHTSNWDLLWMLLFAWSAGIRVSWLAKHTLFVGPLGWFLRRLGGVPVVRHVREDRVASTARTFTDSARAEAPLVLVIPPEGTRGHTEYWKSGFYHIARSAQVAVVPTALDYGRKLGEFGPAMDASGDLTAFMDAMRAFYADRSGRIPERFGPVRLREEDAADLPPVRRAG